MKTKLFTLILFLALIVIGNAQKADLGEAFKNENFEEVIWLSDQLVQDNLKDFETLLTVGKAYNILNEFSNAIPYLKQANQFSEKEWHSAWAYTELMESSYSMGNSDQAKKYYSKASHFDATDNCKKKLNALALLFGFHNSYKKWQTDETENIIFHFQKGVDIIDKKKYMYERQKAFDNINTFFKATLPKKIDFFVWKTNEEAMEVLNKPIGFTNPKFCVSHNRHNQTKGHEIAHNISFWADSHNTRVRFINEGIGVYFDQANYSKLNAAKNVMEGKKKVSIKDLWLNGENYPEKMLYPIAGAFVEHLITHDKAKFFRLLKNQTFENAKSIYGNDFYYIINKFNDKLYKN